ncbi:MAG: cell division protein FtsZ [Prevotellaceae bacterium]|jgi:cell division protein FtsZ|nr:cell division protein FtsZ [Prevotellaceae bacterium]
MNEVFIPTNWEEKLNHIIKVIGVGGGGNNAVKNMYNKGIKGVDFIICNTDAQVLEKSPVPNKIQIGVKLTGGLGAGCDPKTGRDAALENIEDIKAVLSQNDTRMVFITAGLGGGTGTGATPVIAKEAKGMGLLTVAIVTLPFKDEGEEPYKRAIDGLQSLRKNVDSLLIINNQKLYEMYSDLSIFDAFPNADDVVTTAAKSIAELITVTGYINVDFADVKMVMKDSDMALMGLGKAAGENRVRIAAEQALSSPLLNNNDISGARNILVNISSGMKKPFKVSELGELMKIIREASGGKANFKRGVTKDESLDDESSEAEIAVTIVATGFSISNSFPDIDGGVEIDPEDYGQNGRPNVIQLEDKEYDDDYNSTVYVKSYQTIDLTEAAETSVKTVNPPEQQLPLNPAGTASAYNSMNEMDIAMLEKIPAYERAKTKIVIGSTVIGEGVYKHRLDESDGNHVLGENNSYLNRDVD